MYLMYHMWSIKGEQKKISILFSYVIHSHPLLQAHPHRPENSWPKWDAHSTDLPRQQDAFCPKEPAKHLCKFKERETEKWVARVWGRSQELDHTLTDSSSWELMAWHTYIKYWEVCAKLNTCLLKAYVFAVQTATRASQATCSWQKPITQQKNLKGGFPQGNSALLPIAQCVQFCKLNMFCSFSIYVKKMFPQHRPSLCPFLLCFIVQYRNCQFYSLHCCTGLCNPHKA